MKKLSITCISILTLFLVLMSSPALAINFELIADPLCPGNGSTTEVGLWVKSMPCSNMKAFDVCVSYDPTYLSIDTTADITVDACISAFAAPIKYEPDPGCIRIGGAQATGTTCSAPGGDYLLATLIFTQIAEPPGTAGTPVVASVSCGSSTCPSDPFTGFVGCEAGNQSPTDGGVNICAKMCVLNITPGDTTIYAEETVDFDPVYDPANCPGATHNFYIDNPGDCSGSINATSGVFTAADVTAQEICTVCVEDTTNANACYESGADCCSDVTINPTPQCTIFLKAEDVTVHPGDGSVKVPVSMKNPSDKVLAIETILMDYDNNLTCTGCMPDPTRAPDFICFTYEQILGGCKVVMATLSPDALIAEAAEYGTIFTVDYLIENASWSECTTVVPSEEDTIIINDLKEQVETCVEAGEICFDLCGDVFPPIDDTNCGDGAVNIFDVLEEIDFVLGSSTPSECQELRVNVPTGLPPGCTAPDPVGTQPDILDVLVIIDELLDKPNCCD